ncbi:MAG: conjugal transfer protein TrbE [Pseudomonadota bacterium]
MLRTRSHADLSELIVWGTLVAPGVILNKDGSLQTSFRFRGPDLASATEAGLVATMARINNAIRRLGSGWSLHVEARRRISSDYPPVIEVPLAASLIDRERHQLYAASGTKLTSDFYLTFSYILPEDRTVSASRYLFQNQPPTKNRPLEEQIAVFRETVQQITDLLSPILPMIEPLDDQETLTYLHSCVSFRPVSLKPPEGVQLIDSFLYDTDLLPGLAPRLGERWLKMLGVLGFPAATMPALLDCLNGLPIEYRWTSRFLFMDKTDAEAELGRLQRQWFAKRKSFGRLLIEMISKEESGLINTDALNKAADANDALTELAEDAIGFGHFTPVVTVWGEDPDHANEKLALVRGEVEGLGFTAKAESFNALEAWLSTLPGHNWRNVRRPLVSSLNLAHMLPLSAVWSGERWNLHLDTPALLVGETQGATPFHLNLHTGDVGHTMIVGPTGAGKSTLLALLAAQFLRYPEAKVVIFDKGGSARAITHAVGGQYFRLGDPDSVTLQPLAGIDQESERAFAQSWLAEILHRENVDLSPYRKEAVWSALGSLATFPIEQRTLTLLVSLVQDQHCRQALMPYMLDGPYGGILDASRSTSIEEATWQCFEMEALTELPDAVAPTLLAIFHRLEKTFTGAPALLILDEAWLFLEDSLFAAQIKAWLKTLRKKNVSVLFATQSLADIEQSNIAATLIDACPQKIFLPNERAREALLEGFYRRFGLNDRQLDLIAEATPKSDYYMVSPRGNRLFSLTLGPIAKAFCGASTPEDHRLMDRLFEPAASAGFAEAWLEAKGVNLASNLTASHELMEA